MTLARGLGGALPIGACITAPAYGDTLQPGDHGSTFAGGPLIATAAMAVLDVVDDPALLRRVRDLGATLRERLEAIGGVREVRGRGLMLGVGLGSGLDSSQLAAALLDAGLVVNAPEPGTLRLLPPLTISEAEVEQAIAALRTAIDATH